VSADCDFYIGVKLFVADPNPVYDAFIIGIWDEKKIETFKYTPDLQNCRLQLQNSIK
jgi:hypothetical protein